jgi:phosphopantetheinyl transferase
MAAVAVCKNAAVGVDIEKIDFSKKERLKKLIARFCKNVRTSESKAGVSKKYIVDLGKNQLRALEAIPETPTDCEAEFIEWTVLEAALKHDGTGFERVKSFDNIIKDLKTESAVISAGGERYALSVAVKK